jgi:mannose-6-phosphate isomerase-like protein (cupin superfamily)
MGTVISKIPALYISLDAVKRDAALSPDARGARKLLVTEVYPKTEQPAVEPVWEPPPSDGLCPVQETRDTEVAVFNERTVQDRHYHRIGTEIYMLLEGKMLIEVENQAYWLQSGDMIVISPGACHEVKPQGTQFLCRVVTANCGGAEDKFRC